MTSSRIWVIRMSVFCSTPLARLITGTSSGSVWLITSATPRTPWLGVTTITASVPLIASARSAVALTAGPSVTSDRNIGLRPSALMPSAISGSRAHNVTSTDFSPRSHATAVPHEPAPITDTFIASHALRV